MSVDDNGSGVVIVVGGGVEGVGGSDVRDVGRGVGVMGDGGVGVVLVVDGRGFVGVCGDGSGDGGVGVGGVVGAWC